MSETKKTKEKEKEDVIPPYKPLELVDEVDEVEPWLLSYSDMMTLIACFFILLVAFANYDPKSFTEKSKQVAEHFNKGANPSQAYKLKEMQEEVAKHPEILKMSKISVIDNGLLITLSGTVLFPENGFTLDDSASASIDSLIDIIKTFNPDYNIIIEGHSDNSPLPPKFDFMNHWSLAGARGASVVERFEYFGYNPANIRLVSYGDSSPLAPNQDKNGKPIIDNQKLNRRVVLKVIQPFDKQSSMKLGLGVLLNQK